MFTRRQSSNEGVVAKRVSAGRPWSRRRRLRRLGKARDPAALHLILRGLEDEAASVRATAAWAAGQTKTPGVRCPELVSALSDPDKNVRLAAALALADTHDPRALRTFLEAYGNGASINAGDTR